MNPELSAAQNRTCAREAKTLVIQGPPLYDRVDVTLLLTRIIPATHPSLPGHFPEQPIVPGVVILDEIVSAVAEWQPQSRVAVISSVKFRAALNPEEPFHISLHLVDAAVEFSCHAGIRILVQGRLLLAARAS